MTELFDLDFPRAHGPLLGQGIIRSQPADFVVEEVLGFEPEGEGEHAYVWLEKTSANTGWVSEQLAAWLNVRHFDVSYAGKKDRHAVTRQWFSCWLPGLEDPDWQSFDCEGVRILDVKRHVRKLRRGVHKGNRFQIILRDVQFDEDPSTRLAQIRELGFPNYFGPQRFGIQASNLVLAEKLFQMIEQEGKKPSDKALRIAGLSKKKRGMVISAARSFIFNRRLAEILAEAGDLTGTAWMYGASPHRDIVIEPLEDAYTHWGLGLVMLDVKAMARPLWVMPEDMTWTLDDNHLSIQFELPSGAYATALLAELMSVSAPVRFPQGLNNPT